MLTPSACSCLAVAAAAFWLVQPGFAQAPGEPVPPELRIIEDLPEATAEGERLISGDEALEERTDEILNAEDEERDPGEKGIIARETGPGSLFEENRSLSTRRRTTRRRKNCCLATSIPTSISIPGAPAKRSSIPA